MRVNAALKPHHEGRHESAGQSVGGQHRKYHRLRQRRKQESGHARKKEHGNKNDADAQGRDQGRQGDFTRANQNAVLQSFARAQVALDILDGHGRVIHQNANRQGQTAERHQVDRFPERAQHGQGSQNGKWNGNGNDQRAPPRTEKQ